MDILLVEDEKHAVIELKRLISLLSPEVPIRIVGEFDTIKDSVNWLNSNQHPSLIFMDIQLADGLSFEIFQQCTINSAIIFTTAYDEYAIRAFKINSIDYLVKPIEIDQLKASFQKYFNLNQIFLQNAFAPKLINELLHFQGVKYKSRFVSKIGDKIKYIPVDLISYFFAEGKIVYAVTKNHEKHIIDQTLEMIAPLLDPEIFFRINRKIIAKIDAIESIEKYFNGRLLIKLRPELKEETTTISKEKAMSFRTWLGE